MTTSPPLDDAKLKLFTQRMIGHLTGASAMLMVEVGRQTGLFEAMAGMPPATSGAIAERASLNERYVREWLGAMACSGIVEYDAIKGSYALPAEHAALLTGPGSRNVAGMGPFFPLLSRGSPQGVAAVRPVRGARYAA